MQSSRDARVAVIDHDTSKEIATKDNPRFNNSFKESFADLKARTLLAHALSPDTPEGMAAATGAQLVRLWRSYGITEDQISIAWR